MQRIPSHACSAPPHCSAPPTGMHRQRAPRDPLHSSCRCVPRLHPSTVLNLALCIVCPPACASPLHSSHGAPHRARPTPLLGRTNSPPVRPLPIVPGPSAGPPSRVSRRRLVRLLLASCGMRAQGMRGSGERRDAAGTRAGSALNDCLTRRLPCCPVARRPGAAAPSPPFHQTSASVSSGVALSQRATSCTAPTRQRTRQSQRRRGEGPRSRLVCAPPARMLMLCAVCCCCVSCAVALLREGQVRSLRRTLRARGFAMRQSVSDQGSLEEPELFFDSGVLTGSTSTSTPHHAAAPRFAVAGQGATRLAPQVPRWRSRLAAVVSSEGWLVWPASKCIAA